MGEADKKKTPSILITGAGGGMGKAVCALFHYPADPEGVNPVAL